MTHIDEGTIHAWLDGALTPSEGAAVEAHTASCAQCAAQVAEARGLLAGASRILSALDEVPAGVVPVRAPDITWAKPRRRWLRPTGWAVAAGVMLAVGVMTARRQPAVPPAPTAKATPQPNAAPASSSPHTGTLNKSVKTQAVPTAVGAAVPTFGMQTAAKSASAPAVRDSVAAPRAMAAGAEEPRRAVGLERSTMRLDAVVTGGAGAIRLAKDPAQLGVQPVCFTDGVRVLILDTASVAGDDRARLAVRDTSGVVGEWQRVGADSVALRIARPVARTVWGMMREGAVDFSGAGMVTASCEAVKR
ncbi:MAG TPA: zf-HC2 domain-containing protein [Gemmatimonadaceae bacterium]